MGRRLGLVVHGQPPELVGGTERLVADLAADLAGAGHEVEVFCGSIEWRPALEVVRDESGPVPVVRVHREDLFFERWDKLEHPGVERAYRTWLEAFVPELVHVHHWARLTTNPVAVARATGRPAVASLHDSFASCPRYHRVKADLSFCAESPGPDVCRHCAPRWTFQGDDEIDAQVSAFVGDLRGEVERADALVVPTAGHGERVLGWLGVRRAVHAIPPPGSRVPRQAARPLGERPARAGDPLHVGVFGHLHELKGVEVLLAAHAALANPEAVHVHVWGRGPTDEADAALRARAGGPTTFHGAYEPADLSGAPLDVVVLPTLCAESYSFALDEAASLGVPVLATGIGACADRATPRVTLFARGDAGDLARRLEALGRDPDRRAAMRAAPPPRTSDRAEQRRAHEAVYEEVLAGPRPVARPFDADGLARRQRAFALREHGLRELLRSEGWEAVVADLERRLAEGGG